MKKIITKLKELEAKYKLTPFREVGLFMIIILAVHFLYRLLARNDFQVLGIQIISPDIFNYVATVLFKHSLWINKHILGLHFAINGNNFYFLNPNYPIESNMYQSWLGVGESCSSVKQSIQFISLMLLYPGPWKHKLWFIPTGILIIHIVNIFRIVSLSIILVTINSQDVFTFSHDWILRPFFYVVIFGMWVFWTEKIMKKKLRG